MLGSTYSGKPPRRAPTAYVAEPLRRGICCARGGTRTGPPKPAAPPKTSPSGPVRHRYKRIRSPGCAHCVHTLFLPSLLHRPERCRSPSDAENPACCAPSFRALSPSSRVLAGACGSATRPRPSTDVGDESEAGNQRAPWCCASFGHLMAERMETCMIRSLGTASAGGQRPRAARILGCSQTPEACTSGSAAAAPTLRPPTAGHDRVTRRHGEQERVQAPRSGGARA